MPGRSFGFAELSLRKVPLEFTRFVRMDHRPWPVLRSYVAHLESLGELKRITAEVDPKHEIGEIVQRVIRQDGPALLFERVKGAEFPLVMNLFGSHRRIVLALGRDPAEIGAELLGLAQRLNPPSLKAFWEARAQLLRARHMKPRVVGSAAWDEVSGPPRLSAIPNAASSSKVRFVRATVRFAPGRRTSSTGSGTRSCSA